MTTGYDNDNNRMHETMDSGAGMNGQGAGTGGAPQGSGMNGGGGMNGSSGMGGPQGGSQGGWTPYQDDQSRQEFFHRYSDVFREPGGGYQGSYGTPGGQPGYQPQQQPPHRERKHRSGRGRGAALIAACLVVSLVGGAAGSWGMTRLTGGGGRTVFYQAAGSGEDSGSTISAGYTGGELSVEEIAAVASPSVVEITTETVTTHSFFSQYIQEGAGSGVILSEDGTIVTNNHVVEDASRITVRTKDGTEYEATLVGADSKTDVAVLKIDATGLTPAVLGDSDSLIVGEYVMAIGNPLGQLGGTVTDGIISALSRDVTINGETMTLLQTNAAINPGNSGGGLFNEKGELVGIVNAKSSDTSSTTTIEGLGFAIPINTVKNTVQEILDYGYVRGRAALGVTLIDITDAQTMFQYRVDRMGVYVAGVTEGGACDKAGVQVGDCIISIGDVAVTSYTDIKAQLNNHSVGDTVQLQVIRDGRTLTLSVTLDEYRPEASEAVAG